MKFCLVQWLLTSQGYSLCRDVKDVKGCYTEIPGVVAVRRLAGGPCYATLSVDLPVLRGAMIECSSLLDMFKVRWLQNFDPALNSRMYTRA